jgi:hypothetical protein
MFAVGLIALFMPVMASAQGGYDPWGRNRNDNYGRYDQRYLRDSIHRLDRLAKEFEKDLDRALDRSRTDGTRREDNLNNQARQFREAVSDLKSDFGNGRDLNRTRDEAQRVMQEARQLDRIATTRRIGGSEVSSDWAQIRRELQVISNAYGLGSYGYDDGYYRNDRRNRTRTNNNNDWWRRIPWPNQ